MIADIDVMGAPIREWLIWSVLAAIAAIGVGYVLVLPLHWLWRTAVLAAAAFLLIVQAFRRLPTFDPLRRVRARVPSARRSPRCAITFDDGPSRSTARVLDVLAAQDVKATFFVLGEHVDRHPDVVRRAVAEGHAIGIHGYNHRQLAGAPQAVVERQVREATAALARAGIEPPRLYRTPHGYKSRGVFAVARRRGLTLWAWSRGVWDTDRPRPADLVRRATRRAAPGMVLLLHDGLDDQIDPDVSSMLAALPAIIGELKARGFSFVRLADA
jgi:peptidoglycan/xylan/chitin deacetylase (PgdA/CDA1 family)